MDGELASSLYKQSPKRIEDLYRAPTKLLSNGLQLQANHPGFDDPIYRARRQQIADCARIYKHGDPIPQVKYTREEINTWGTVYKGLTRLYPTHACREFNEAIPDLFNSCCYAEDNIPQLDDVSKYLKGRTGFVLRPAGGLVSFRDFLSGLAFRVFHATQYVRHASVPTYSPEPDVCHELLGHAAMFANAEFADLAQEIGLASLGASDESIEQLGTCYWFTIEVGLCRQNGELKAYGGALLSSIGELEYCLSNKSNVLPFDPHTTARRSFPLTEYQPIYYATKSFDEAKELMKKYSKSLMKTSSYEPDFSAWGAKYANFSGQLERN